ncbi:hypothetical protein [Thalassoporum mexicanum]|nr:hypothetical protein [Pseudanabaena sp. PCC 7367]
MPKHNLALFKSTLRSLRTRFVNQLTKKYRLIAAIVGQNNN